MAKRTGLECFLQLLIANKNYEVEHKRAMFLTSILIKDFEKPNLSHEACGGKVREFGQDFAEPLQAHIV